MSKKTAKRRGGRAPKIVAGTIAGLALLGGGAYVAGYFMAGDRTPKNTTIAGLPVGGMTEDEAEAKLRAELAPKAEAAITLQGAGKTAQIKPAQAGLVIDYAATVDAAGAGKSWSPRHILTVLRGGGDLPVVTRQDPALLKQKVEAVAPAFAVQPKDATIRLDGAKVVTTEGVNGQSLDVDKATAEVKSAWRQQTTVAAPLNSSEPQLTTGKVTQFADEKLKPLLSGPVIIKIDQHQVKVSVDDIAAATTVTTSGAEVSASTDIEKVYAAVKPDIDKLPLPEGRDASVKLVDGKPQVVPSVDGMGVAKADVIKAVEPALTKPAAERTVTVKPTKKPAKYTTAMAQKAGIKEVTGEFTTEFPYAEYRNINLTKAASKINGVFLAPGEVFSLNDTLGPRDEAHGWAAGYVIQGGVMKKEVGGGISQSATTTFNAIFFAGLEDVEHHPHTLYFPRYPAGREATLYGSTLDLRFRNNTPYGVIMQAYTTKAAPGKKGAITVRVWSTKHYDKVESTPLARSNYTTGRRIEKPKGPECEYQAPIQGFDVNYARLFYRGGSVVKRENFFWRYQPGDEIVCK